MKVEFQIFVLIDLTLFYSRLKHSCKISLMQQKTALILEKTKSLAKLNDTSCFIFINSVLDKFRV